MDFLFSPCHWACGRRRAVRTYYPGTAALHDKLAMRQMSRGKCSTPVPCAHEPIEVHRRAFLTLLHLPLFRQHYIPAAADFSDLEKTVRYVVDPANAEQMRKIVKNGQEFCRTKLTMEQYTVDILWTLLAYAEVLAGSPDFYDLWKKDESAYTMEELRMAPWKPRVAEAKQ